MLKRLKSRTKVDPQEVNSLRQRIGELDSEIANLVKAIRKCPDIDEIVAELGRARRERDRLTAELPQVDRTNEPVDIDAEADEVVDKLWSLSSELLSAKPERLRELLTRFIARIELTFGSVQKTKRVEHPFQRGVVELRPSPLLEMYKPVNRGDWI